LEIIGHTKNVWFVVLMISDYLHCESMDIDRLVALHPRLYHMTEAGAWESIRSLGLMSASATLDFFGIGGAERLRLESTQRSGKTRIITDQTPGVVLRDQRPMPRSQLLVALEDGMTPEAWYRTINSKVFFWVSHARLECLLNARSYRHEQHDVLTIDSAPLIRAYAEQIRLSPMNSGNTFPMPAKRSARTFSRIREYPVTPAGSPKKRIVELVVEYSVPDIASYVLEVRRMMGVEVLRKIL
jgi:hypothetical protein